MQNAKTRLTGGQITSTQAAVDNNKNTFTSAGGTETKDLQNSANYSANSVSIGLGTNSHVAGNTVNIENGGDTTLKGAVVKGDQVTANVAGNLNIESLQDQNQYKESSKSVGGSVMVGITTTGPASGSLSLGKTSINSTYTSVGEQSAIRAGDGGFDVNVNGKTTLTGGLIQGASAAVATAGRDLNLTSTTQSSFNTAGANSFARAPALPC